MISYVAGLVSLVRPRFGFMYSKKEKKPKSEKEVQYREAISNARVWEARLEATEKSRQEYRQEIPVCQVPPNNGVFLQGECPEACKRKRRHTEENGTGSFVHAAGNGYTKLLKTRR